MITVPTLQVIAGVVIALFLLQLVRRLTVNAQNPIAASVNDGVSFLVAG